MLSRYLEVIKKKLASQMLKLPSVAQLQHRGVVEKAPKRALKRQRPANEDDDPEIRFIKRTLIHVKESQKRAQTAFR
jgi:hypothetical protein